MTRVIESLHEYVCTDGGLRIAVRFWQEEEELHGIHENRSWPELKRWHESLIIEPTLSEVAEFLAALPYCNAVQVSNDTTKGPAILIYPEWP